jgi:UDP-N-acetylglucosamine--N-acetylmuramyl-(pentapeptide) pyrophosphoryl-undecaprenol N-acetylglucosamine transferase
VQPALAVADAWRDRVAGSGPLLIGPDEAGVAAAVHAAGHRFACLPAAPFARQGPLGKMRALALATVGAVRRGRGLLRDERAALVLGFGSYASASAAVAARSLGIPVLLHEANAVPGLANRVAARLTSGVLLGFAQAATGLRAAVRVTGTPLRPTVAALAAVQRTPPASGARRCVLVAGGSLGSPFLDRHAPGLLARAQAAGCALAVTHVVGLGDAAATRAAYATARIPAEVVPWIDDMAEAYARNDVALVTAGAVTLAEIAVAGIPAIVVPLARAAHDHQSANARAFAVLTGAAWFSERDWREDIAAAHLLGVLESDAGWRRASDGVRAFARPDATAAVVDACGETIARGALVRPEVRA